MNFKIFYESTAEIIKPMIEVKIAQIISSAMPLPPGFIIIKPRINWIDNKLFVKFKIQTPFLPLALEIKGNAKINDGEIDLNIDLPKSVLRKITEEEIILAITNQFNSHILQLA